MVADLVGYGYSISRVQLLHLNPFVAPFRYRSRPGKLAPLVGIKPSASPRISSWSHQLTAVDPTYRARYLPLHGRLLDAVVPLWRL